MTDLVDAVGDRLVFVVGARRSGTNWLQRTLCAHPDVVGTNGESFLFTRGIAPLMSRFHHSSPDAPALGSVFANRGRVVEAVRGVCDVVFGDLLELLGPAERLVDRSPEHITCVDLLAEVYPGARIVHIIRDGRDVVRSLLSMEWGPAEAEAAAEEWRSAVVDGRAAGARLANYREVRYEELLADPAAHVVPLFEWIGVRTGADVLEPVLAEAARAFTVDPKMATIGSGKWRSGLDPAALGVLERVAGDALVELGYDDGAADERAAAACGPPGPEPAPVAKGTTAAPPRRWARLARRAGPPGRDRASEEWDFRNELHTANQVANRFLSAIAAGDEAELDGLLADDVHLAVVGSPDAADGLGTHARSRLLELLRTDQALRWPQRPGRVLSSVPTTVAFLAYTGPDGQVARRTLAVTVRGGRVTAVVYDRCPT